MRSCNSCIHRLPCLARAGLEDIIRDFKLLSLTKDEQLENNTPTNVGALKAALAGSCVVFVREGGE